MKENVICCMIPLGPNFMSRSFGTICSIFIGPVNTTYEDGTNRLFRKVGICNSDAEESTTSPPPKKKKEYKIHNTAKVWNQKNCELSWLFPNIRTAPYIQRIYHLSECCDCVLHAGPRDMTICLVFSTFTSRPVSLLVTTKGAVFFSQ
jgi:hypothetical protein